METAIVIKKVIEGYDCEHAINLFIALAQFTNEISVEYDLCNNSCVLMEFLIGAVNTGKEIELFQNHAMRNYKYFFFYAPCSLSFAAAVFQIFLAV